MKKGAAHFTANQWLAYIKGELEEETMVEMEDHLYVCDQCLHIYTALIATDENVSPIADGTAFTDQVMEGISRIDKEKLGKPVPSKRGKGYVNQTIVHYAIAAGLTVVLMFSGVFEKLSEGTGTVQGTDFQRSESLTENMLNKTFSLLDSIKEHAKEAEKE